MVLPYSVTMWWTCARVVVTADPGVRVGTMRETCPSIDGSSYGMLPALAWGVRAVAARVRIGTPCGASAAPWRKSICPPTPLYCFVPIDSEQIGRAHV